jgi:ClpX C4-type zinc finger
MSKPPPALGNYYVIEYAIADDEVTFEQRHVLNVGGEWLGAVSNLVIGQGLDNEEFVVFHCNDKWEVLGVAAGYKSIKAAKEKTERSYHGLSKKWKPSGCSREEALAHIEEAFKDHRCSFCGKSPLEFQAMVEGEGVRICNICVESFYEEMHNINRKT